MQNNPSGADFAAAPIALAAPVLRPTRQARIAWGDHVVTVGGGAPVRIQSMTNTDTVDAIGTAIQVKELALAGSELVRITVDRDESAAAHAGRCKAGQDGQARMTFEFDECQVLDDERTGQGAERFTDEVAIRKARLRRQDVDQGSDQADAQGLLVTRLGQADGDTIRGDGPVRRDAADAR